MSVLSLSTAHRTGLRLVVLIQVPPDKSFLDPEKCEAESKGSYGFTAAELGLDDQEKKGKALLSASAKGDVFSK